MDRIRELANISENGSTVQSCERCGEPTSRSICQSCTMKEWFE